MVLNGFMPDPNAGQRSVWAQHNVGMLNYSMPVTVSPNIQCIKVVDILKKMVILSYLWFLRMAVYLEL